MADINITLGGLSIWIADESQYPDHLDDLASRAKNLFNDAIKIAEENGHDIMEIMIFDDFGEED